MEPLIKAAAHQPAPIADAGTTCSAKEEWAFPSGRIVPPYHRPHRPTGP
jgi:hypothetical protein